MSTLANLIRALREGENPDTQHAAWEELSRLARTYVRARMGVGDRRAQESMDVVNSVLGSLAEDFRHGRVLVDDEQHLRRHLHLVIRRKLTDLGRKQRAEKRGGEQTPVPMARDSQDDIGVRPEAPDASAGTVARAADLESWLTAPLKARDRIGWRMYLEDHSWGEIGAALGISADAARHRVGRIRAVLAARMRRSEGSH